MLPGDQAAASFRDYFVKPENPKSGQNEAGLCQEVWILAAFSRARESIG